MKRLYSWEYEDLPKSEHWFIMARAYLNSSQKVFNDINDGAIKRSYYFASVGAFLFEHSIELFLKAAIVQAGNQIQSHHELQTHYRQYGNLYPGKKFQFKGKIEDVVKIDQSRPKSEFHRYPTDNSGMLWQVNTHFNLEIWIEQLTIFSDDFERLRLEIQNRYPIKI